MSKVNAPWAAALLLTAAFAASAETLPPRGSVDARVRVMAYNPEDVVKLHGYVGYQIHIQWAPGEEFVNLGAGDQGGFDVGVEKNHFFIKPKQPKVSTNITVLTTRHAYHFDYSASKRPPGRNPPSDQIYSLRFTYPEDDARRLAEAAARQRLEDRLSQAQATRPRNLDYAYCGPPALKPIAAFDDGLQTHLTFAHGGAVPAFFVQNDDGSEALVNFHVDRDELVLHRIAHRFVLRRGDLVGCIVNRSIAIGIGSPTHTTDPGVERVTRGATP